METKDMIICRCEEVRLSFLKETVERYGTSPRELKLRTRAGMGYCGGRVCRPMIEAVVSALSYINRKDPLLKYQPPARPVSFTDLGGEE